MSEIDEKGVPDRQQSTRYDLLHEGRRYPPKRVVRVANKYANGEELWGFYGGQETNTFLKKLGFDVTSKHGEP